MAAGFGFSTTFSSNFTDNDADERSITEDDIKETETEDWVKPYPNPFSDILTVEVDLDKNGEVKIELIGLTGRVVSSSLFSGEKGENTFTLNPIRDGQQGIFILKVTAPDGKEHYQKVTHINF